MVALKKRYTSTSVFYTPTRFPTRLEILVLGSYPDRVLYPRGGRYRSGLRVRLRSSGESSSRSPVPSLQSCSTSDWGPFNPERRGRGRAPVLVVVDHPLLLRTRFFYPDPRVQNRTFGEGVVSRSLSRLFTFYVYRGSRFPDSQGPPLSTHPSLLPCTSVYL